MLRSIQTLLPFILATLGWFISLVAGNMPLFEWRVSNLVTDFPAGYEVHIAPSPWVTYFKDSLDKGVHNFQSISVQNDEKLCLNVMRSRLDEILEGVLNIDAKYLTILYLWGQLEIVLLMVYIWVFTIGHESSLGCVYSGVYTVIAGMIFIFTFQVTRLFGNTPHLYMPEFGKSNCYGTLSFNAELLKVHYETPFVLFLAIGLQLGALVVVFYQIRKSVDGRKESS
jgi:hypothetical protein